MDATEALAVLGVREETDLAGVRAAYHRLVRASHPDLTPGDAGAHARTARLTEAYEVAVDHVTRRPHTPPAPARPAPPPPPARTRAAPVQSLDEHTLVLELPPTEAFSALYEAAGHIGEISYQDRRLGILEMIVRFEGGPSCSVVMSIERAWHGDAGAHSEVSCTMESIESAPAPPIAPVVDALVAELRSL